MPWWLGLGGLLLGLFQQSQQQQAYNQALRMAEQGGLSEEELAALREQAEGRLRSDLARRGLMDSSLLTGGRAAIEGELALARARARAPFRHGLINMLLSRSQQPTILSGLVPLVLQYGLRSPAGQWWLPPYQSPYVTTTGLKGT